MEARFNKAYLPGVCENCDKCALVFIDDFEQSYFVICHECGEETHSLETFA